MPAGYEQMSRLDCNADDACSRWTDYIIIIVHLNSMYEYYVTETNNSEAEVGVNRLIWKQVAYENLPSE